MTTFLTTDERIKPVSGEKSSPKQDLLEKIGLTSTDLVKSGGLLDWLGYIVHGDRAQLASSNVADVFNSIINMVGPATTITVIMLSASFAQRFGK